MKVKKVLLGSLFLVLAYIEPKVVRTVSVSMVEERVDGQLFCHRIDVVDGVTKESFTIDNKHVERDSYDQRILAAELEERRVQREKEYQKRMQLVEFKHQARCQAIKQLLHKTVLSVEKMLAKFERYELKPFMVYSPATVANEVDFSNITTYMISPARDLLVKHFDAEQAKSSLEQLEGYPDKLASLFEDTVQNAITKCDDPKKLKNWLEMLS